MLSKARPLDDRAAAIATGDQLDALPGVERDVAAPLLIVHEGPRIGAAFLSGLDRAARARGLELAAAPAFGTWQVGDKVEHAPAGGNVGWVSTTAGSPGTWRTYGAIAS